MYKYLVIFFSISQLFVFSACNRDVEKKSEVIIQQIQTPPKMLFREPVKPESYELPSGALATWRKFSQTKPVLVLFSKHPLLDSTPDNEKKAVTELIKKANDTEIIRRGQISSADTLFLPPQTLSIAIDNNFFSEIILVLPSLKTKNEFTLEAFLQRARPAGFFTEAELASMRLHDGIILGTVRNVPIQIAHPDSLPKIDRPVILHVDLGYFSGMYINEIKTPSYQLIYNVANDIRSLGYTAIAVTLSSSNQEVDFSLESRFLIRDLSELFHKPDILNAPTPRAWEMRASALYASTMFDESKARELTALAAESYPEDAAALYALSLELFKQKLDKLAFDTLARAVVQDKGYALAYQQLAVQGFNIGQRRKAFELLQKAASFFPDNAFINIELAQQLIHDGETKKARRIINGLQQLNWSIQYHPQIPDLLIQMASAAEADPILPSAATKPMPVTSPSK